MEELVEILTLIRDRAIEFTPRLLLALLIFVAGWALAAMVRSLCRSLLNRASAFAQRRFKSLPGPIARVPWALCGIIPNILYALVILLTLSLMADTMALPLLTGWLNQVTNFLPQAIVAALLVVVGFVGGAWLRSVAEEAMSDSSLPYRQIVGVSIQAITIVVSIVAGTDLLGIDLSFVTTTFYIALAVLGATAGLAFALGCRATVENIVACYALSAECRPGIRVRVAEYEGRIVKIAGGYVQLETASGLVILPGARFAREVSVLVKDNGNGGEG